LSVAAWRLLVATRSGRRPRSWRRVRSRRRRPKLLSRRGGSGAELLARRRRSSRLRIASRRRRSRRLIAARRRWCAGLGVASGRLTGRCTVGRPGRLRLTIGRARRLRLTIGAWRRRRVATHGCSLPLRRDALGRRPLLLWAQAKLSEEIARLAAAMERIKQVFASLLARNPRAPETTRSQNRLEKCWR
jgi:hypothetical protein